MRQRCFKMAIPQGSSSFRDIYCLSTSSLGCKALCLFICFLVLCFICFRFSPVYFKNGPEYLTRDTASILVLFIRFLLYSFVPNSFLLPRYSFLFFFSFPFVYYYFYSLEFFTSNWSLSDSKSPQVSRTLLSILSVLNNIVVWRVSARPPTSKSSRPFRNPLVTVQNAPITIGIIVTFMFHSFFNSLARLKVLIHLFTFFQFYSVVSRDSKIDNFPYCLFFFFGWLL